LSAYSNTVAPYYDAPGKLNPSRLSNQLEALNDEIDLDKIIFTVDGRTAMQFRNAITSANISRTILGASVLTIGIEDPDLAILRSNVFGTGLTLVPNQGSLLVTGVRFGQGLTEQSAGKKIDVNIDGLWFRMVGIQKDPETRSITLTFEDREINVLRSYPKAGDPNEYLAFRTMDRIHVIQWLVQQAIEFGPKGPRFYSPLLPPNEGLWPAFANVQMVDPTLSAVTHQPGFPAAGNNGVTVKNSPADANQINNISAVLAAGKQLGMPTDVLVMAIMTITQESDAGDDFGSQTKYVGLFQQEQGWNGTGGTGNPTTDAEAFYRKVIILYNQNPSQPLGYLIQVVQGNFQTATGVEYGQWQTESETTVGIWQGTDENVPLPQTPVGTTDPTSPNTPTGPVIEGAAIFTRGSQSNEAGRTVVTREDNWTCIQRLCSEVGWVSYCVSGTIYVESYLGLFQQAVKFQCQEGDPGIDGIGGNIDTGMANAQVTVGCRISRWGAPPGTIFKVNGQGPYSGKWIVQTITRDLFTTAGTITGSKSQGTLSDAESVAPVQGLQTLQASGTNVSKQKQNIIADTNQIRIGIVSAAQKALANTQNYLYLYGGGHGSPVPTGLFIGTPANPLRLDCSSFVDLCYKAGGANDPGGGDYSFLAATSGLIANGTVNNDSPLPGDLLFMLNGGTPAVPGHVVIWVGDGNGTVIQMGEQGKGVQSFIADPTLLANMGQPGNNYIGIYTYNIGTA